MSVFVVRASTRVVIEQSASHSGQFDLARVFVLQLVQAALSASIAERFPFRSGQLSEGFSLPKPWGQAFADNRIAHSAVKMARDFAQSASI
jgi:hypothetical protein